MCPHVCTSKEQNGYIHFKPKKKLDVLDCFQVFGYMINSIDRHQNTLISGTLMMNIFPWFMDHSCIMYHFHGGKNPLIFTNPKASIGDNVVYISQVKRRRPNPSMPTPQKIIGDKFLTTNGNKVPRSTQLFPNQKPKLIQPHTSFMQFGVVDFGSTVLSECGMRHAHKAKMT